MVRRADRFLTAPPIRGLDCAFETTRYNRAQAFARKVALARAGFNLTLTRMHFEAASDGSVHIRSVSSLSGAPPTSAVETSRYDASVKSEDHRPFGGRRMAVTRSALAAVLGSFLLAAPLAAQAGTGTVSGRVVDSASQQPLVSVSVRVVGTTLGALTRNDGSYTIAGLRPGPQQIRATRIGFAAQLAAGRRRRRPDDHRELRSRRRRRRC